MPLHLLDFPSISDQAISDVAFASLDASTLLVVYEAHRDFLSAPRQHIALRVCFADGISMNTCGEWLSDVHWRQIGNSQHSYLQGIYKVESSEVVLGESEEHILVVYPQGLLEFCATEVSTVDNLYHQPSSRAALGEFLQSI